MFNFHYRKIFILFLLCSCLLNKSSNVEAIKCYECVAGRNTFCQSSQMALKECGSDLNSCGFALFNGGITTGMQRVEWRGCYKSGDMNTTVPNAQIANRFDALAEKEGGYLTDFQAYLQVGGYPTSVLTIPTTNIIVGAAGTTQQLIVSQTQNRFPWAFISFCSSDGCNVPRSCYRCASGIDATCALTDIVLDTCTSILHTYCGSITIGTTYWRGCLRDVDNTALTTAASSSTTATAFSTALVNTVRYSESRLTQVCTCPSPGGCTANTCATADRGKFILEPDTTKGTDTFPTTSTYSNFKSCNTNGCNFGTSVFDKIDFKYALFFLIFTVSAKF